MKYIPYITILAVLLSAGCTREELQEEQQQSLDIDGICFSGTVETDERTDDPSTRTVYEDQADRISVQWSTGDMIGLFCEVGEGSDNPVLTAANYGYRNRTVGSSRTADFSEYLLPEEVAYWSDESTPHDFYAYYPYKKTSSGSDADPRAVPVELPAVQQWLSSAPIDYFSDIDFMYAEAQDQTRAEVGEDQPVALDFHHLFPVLQVNIRTTEFVKMDALVFRCTEQGEAVSFGEGSTVDLTTRTITAANATNEIRLEGSLSSMIGQYVSYQMLISPGHAGRSFDIIAEVNGNEYKMDQPLVVPEGGLVGGRTYVVTVDGLYIAPEDAEPVTDLSADATANCYYVTAPNTIYRFRADVKGNGAVPHLEGLPYTEEDIAIAPKSALVLWYTRLQTQYGPWSHTDSPIDLSTLVLAPDGYIYFKTPETLNPGNILVAAFEDDVDYGTVDVDPVTRQITSKVLWSWNLVITDGYDPADASSQFTKGDYTFMTRDLGALIDPSDAGTGSGVNYVTLASTTGNVYQWGRKDPFPGLPDYTSAITNVMTGLWFAPGFTPIESLRVGPYEAYGRVTEGNIFANDASLCISAGSLTAEDVLYTGTENPHLWLNKDGQYLPGAKAAWGNPDHSDPIGVKTIYDPCPPGYKVMSKAAWNVLTDNESEEVAEVSPEGRGALIDGRFYIPFTGGAWWRNTNGSPTSYIGSCNGYVGGSYWFDGSYDAAIGRFNAEWNYFSGNQVVIPDITVESRTYSENTARGCAVRCMKIPVGQALPDGQLDNFDKKEW